MYQMIGSLELSFVFAILDPWNISRSCCLRMSLWIGSLDSAHLICRLDGRRTAGEQAAPGSTIGIGPVDCLTVQITTAVSEAR